MSYQPQQPMGGPPPVPGQYPPAPQAPYPGQFPPQYTPVPPPPSGKKGLRLLGIVLLVLGVAGGAALFFLSGSTREQTIEKFARAPVGCTTTLQFDKTGTFTVYIELTGRLDSLAGDCVGGAAVSYRWTGTTLPSYSLTMVDGNGQPVALSDSTAHAYDTGSWRGQAVSQVQITAPGSYRLSVDSPDAEFAVAVGGDPDADASMMQMAGIGVAVVGVVLGLALIVLGRRKGGTPAAPAPQYAPVAPPAQYPATPYPPAQAPAPAPPPPPGWSAPNQ